MKSTPLANAPQGWFDDWGGRYVPETLIAPLDELTQAWQQLRDSNAFQWELEKVRRDFIGRPTPLYHAIRLSEHHGLQIFLKREDLCHTGAHKINNTVGQVALAQAMGKTRVIAETGAGQHGVATAAAAARLGLRCQVYMGSEDMRRQALNVHRIELFGAEVLPVNNGSCTLKDATSEALRDWVANIADTYYVIGSAVGPHPYPSMVRDFNAITGEEAREQCLQQLGRLPDALIACVGGGSNAIGLFSSFLDDELVKIFGVEAGGRSMASGEHAATLSHGRAGVLHGALSYLLQDDIGQVHATHSISAGLDYPGIGPEHSQLKDTKRVEYFSASDDEVLQATSRLCRLEGILPALESAHALAGLEYLKKCLPADSAVLLNLSGRGDKDVETLRDRL